jgi:hypothetical protein
MSTQDLARKEVLSLNPLKEHQQCEVTTIRKDNNKNGKRNPETHIKGNKARKLSKKKDKLEKIWEVLENTSQETDL